MPKEVFKLQTAVGGNAGQPVLAYNKDRSIEGSFYSPEAVVFLADHGPKSFWLTEFVNGMLDLTDAEKVEDPGW